jgi:hypothetical protein
MESATSPIDPGRLKHLEMLQVVIARMASNSFLVKGWSLTLFSAILVVGATAASSIIWVAVVPVIAFWMLDGFFLRQERLYRGLYDLVRVQAQDSLTDFSMATGNIKGVANWFSVMFSRTLILFHVPLLVVLAIVFCIMRCSASCCY